MKRILKHLKKNWIRHGFETLAVLFGVLAAFALNDWNENRKNRNTEEKLLIELKENVEINITRLKDEIQKEHNSISAINLVVDHIDNRRPYHDSLDVHFRQAFRAYDIVLSSSAFESIKSKGFDIIHSDLLRNEIIELFDVTYSNLISETVRLENQFWPSSVLPILHTHFRSEGDIMVPIDYEALSIDTRYTNMITHRRHFRELAIERKDESLLQTESLLTHLNNYLEFTKD